MTGSLNSKLSSFGLVLPTLALVVVALLYPLGAILMLSVTSVDGNWSIDVYRQIMSVDAYRSSIVTTLVLSAEASLICGVLGYAMAYRMARDWSHVAGLLIGVLLLSFWIGLLIRTFAWMILLGRRGAVASLLGSVGITDIPQLLYNRTGALIGIVNIVLPYMVFTLYAVMRRIDPTLLNSAASLGATPFRAFWRVYFPLTLPGLWAGLLLVFVTSVGFYITPELLGGPRTVMISQVVARIVSQMLDFRLAGGLSMVLLIVTLALIYIYNRLIGARRIGAAPP